MTRIFQLSAITAILGFSSNLGIVAPAAAQQSLFIAYPPKNHQTTAEKIFIIGTASPQKQVLINNQAITRSPSGNFAPSFPLTIGENIFKISSGEQQLEIKVNRISLAPKPPVGVAFGEDSLTPNQDIRRLPNELICFSAIAPPNAQVTVNLANKNIPLLPQKNIAELPANSAVLTAETQPNLNPNITKYAGCDQFFSPGNLGKPKFELNLQGKVISQEGSGNIEILNSAKLQVVEVTTEAGVTRTGPSTDYSRLTPLPEGTKASVTGGEGEWLRLDYGAWIKAEETETIPGNIPPKSIIRGVTYRPTTEGIELVFPLQIAVPVSVIQDEQTFSLTLYNTTAQTDTIHLDDNSLIKRLDWRQITPTQVQYNFHLKEKQQWGYSLKYEGTNLILLLRHPPNLTINNSLQGIKILLDPGHGGQKFGSIGPNGYPEKSVNLAVSQLLKQELEQRGATVYLTRDSDIDLSLGERVEMINNLKPNLALSIHYNALPDSGDALNTAGIGVFWYHPQAHNLSVFLHNYLLEKLNRPSYGVFWNNLALTRPHTAPSVLLELGFMINPVEFEWITNSKEQERLAKAIADGISEFLLN